MQMKAATLEIIERCKQGKAKPTNGKLPISKEAQEATDKTLKLQKDLSSVEDMGYPGAKDIAQNIKAEIAKLKPKLPKSDQGLVDQAQALDALRDVREKQAMSENALKAQQQKAQQQQLLQQPPIQEGSAASATDPPASLHPQNRTLDMCAACLRMRRQATKPAANSKQ